MRKGLILSVFILSITLVSSDPLVILNRTGFNFMSLEIFDHDTGNWSGNLIPYDVVLNDDFWMGEIDVQGNTTVRLTDEFGDVYIKELESWRGENKQLVTIQDLQVLQNHAESLNIRISNQLEWPITGLYLSPVNQDQWGDELLSGNILRRGEQVELTLTLRSEGVYDLKIMSYTGSSTREFLIHGVELSNRGLFNIESPE